MKKFYAFAALVAGAAAMVSGCAGTQTTEVKVISYNLRCITADDQGENAWEARREASVNMILAEQPDVIGFQEPWNPQIDYLTSRLPQYSHFEYGRETGLREDGGEHLMVMWNRDKYDLLDSGHFWLSDTPLEVSRGWDAACYRITLWIRLGEKSTGREFYYFDTHLDHMGPVAKREGARLNVEKMKEIVGDDAVAFISGDMNVAVGSPDESLLDPYYEWLQSARDNAEVTDNRPTFTGFGRSANPKIIDYIFYRNATPLKFETLDGENYGVKYISDHYPVAATFRF